MKRRGGAGETFWSDDLKKGDSARGLSAERVTGKILSEKDEDFWVTEGRKRALKLFREAARRVPAYRDFLAKNKVRPGSVRTAADFKELPVTTKKNYISKYSLADRSWGGTLASHSIIAASSGTTGEPMLWPRGPYQESEASFVHELLFTELYEVHKRKTLILIGFPMGVYVSGIATALPSFLTAAKYPNVAIVTVGNNKDSLLHVLPNLQKEYEQILLIGHPFFIKDVVETGRERGVQWGRTKVRMMFCSEGFNEEWRSYLASQIPGCDIHRDIFNTYGSSELLLMGNETPLTILLKETAEKDASIRERLFNGPIVPNLFQYNPLLRYIEEREGDLIFTAASGIPLVRYDLRDSGTTMSYVDACDALDRARPGWRAALRPSKPWNLPLVALYGRSDNTLVFYAANIYPEHVLQALSHASFLKRTTGKFSMKKTYNKNMDQVLTIHVELREGERPQKRLADEIQKHVVTTLERVNMEYLFLRKNLQKDLVPRIDLRLYQDKDYFKPGLKPRYILS